MATTARRKMVRTLRVLQSWPLVYLGAGIVGLIICASGSITGRRTWIQFGMWLTAPLLLLLGWLVMVLTISAMVNAGILLANMVEKVRNSANRHSGE